MPYKSKNKHNKNKQAYFSAGCFWGVQEKLHKIPGIISTTVGYMGGITKRPTYEQVKTGETGHAETIKIIYNPQIISFQQLVDLFFIIHDPTTKNRQGYIDLRF